MMRNLLLLLASGAGFALAGCDGANTTLLPEPTPASPPLPTDDLEGVVTECAYSETTGRWNIAGAATANRNLRDVSVSACVHPSDVEIECDRTSRYFVDETDLER